MAADDAPRMTSLQKVRAALAKLDEVDADTAPPQTQAILLAVTMARGKIVDSLPTDPAQLDELLAMGAGWALALRSDDAEPFELVRGAVREPIPPNDELEEVGRLEPPTEELEPVPGDGEAAA